MTDKTREAFEAFMRALKNGKLESAVFDCDDAGDYVLPTIYAAFFGWQAATKAEQERCARVCEVANSSMTLADCADAIRKGGDA